MMKISIIFISLLLFVLSGCSTKNSVHAIKQKKALKTKKGEFSRLKKELDYKFFIVAKKEDALADANVLESFKGCVYAKKFLAGVPKTLTKMNRLKNDFKYDDYLEKLKRVDEDYDEIKSNITFSVKASNSSKDLQEVLYDALERENLQISEGDFGNHLNITVGKKIKKDSAVIFITLKDNGGRVFTKNRVNISKDDMVMRFYEKIKKEGLDKILGFSK